MNFYFQTFIKDLRIAASYRAQFIFSIFSIFVSIFFIFIFSSLFESSTSQVLDKYGGNYFNFLFIGFITAELTFLFLNTMPNKVREYQMTGIFEELIMSGRREIDIIISSLIYPIVFQVFRLFCYLIALFVLGIDLNFLQNFSIISILAFLLFAVCLIGISFISTAVAILYKSPSIINRLYLSATSIFSGVAFPIELLPKYLETLSHIFPTTHFLNIIRSDSLNSGYDLHIFDGGVVILATSAIFLLVLGIFFFNRSVQIAKKNGSLLLY